MNTVNVKVSKRLLSFLEEWYVWARAYDASEEHDIFRPNWGICRCLTVWSGNNIKLILELEKELENAFRESDLDWVFPFGEVDFYRREESYTIHKSLRRLRWVKSVINNSRGELV